MLKFETINAHFQELLELHLQGEWKTLTDFPEGSVMGE